MKQPVYICKSRVVAPVQKRTSQVGYVLALPIYDANLDDAEGMRRAVLNASAHYSEGYFEAPPPPEVRATLFRLCKVRSWRQLESSAQLWDLRQADQGFEIRRLKRRYPRGWEPDPDRVWQLPPEVGWAGTVDRFIALVMRGREVQ